VTDTAGSAEPGLEARVARLEADVAHMLGDIAEIKATLAARRYSICSQSSA
jgi:hypothetical protein